MHRSTVVHAQGPRRPRGGGAGVPILIIALLAATGGSAYFAYTQYEERGRLVTALAAARQNSQIETLEARGKADQVKKLNTQLNSTQSARRAARKKVSGLNASLRKSAAKVAELEKSLKAAAKAVKTAKAERNKARAGKLSAEKNLAQALRADSAGDAKVRALQAALKKAEQTAKDQAADLARLGKSHEEAETARATAEEKARTARRRVEDNIATAEAEAAQQAADTAKAVKAAKAARAAKAAATARAAKAAATTKAAEAARAARTAAATDTRQTTRAADLPPGAVVVEESRRVTADGEIRTSAPRQPRQSSSFDSVLKAIEEMKLDSDN
jgi:chromosome segregation ATPase